MKVRMGTFHTGPLRKPTRLSKTHASSSSLLDVDFLLDITLALTERKEESSHVSFPKYREKMPLD